MALIYKVDTIQKRTIIVTLQDFLKKHNLTQAEFGSHFGLTQGFISHCITGESNIPPIIAIQIERATNGEIPIDDMITVPELKTEFRFDKNN